MYWMRTTICIQELNKEMVFTEELTNKYDVQELKDTDPGTCGFDQF